jgi:hypothetical protein
MVALNGTDWVIVSSSGEATTIELTAVPVPVGGIYETLDATDPHELWPGTAWEALGAGRTTFGAGGGYSAGATGGSNVLTVAQMASHTHMPTITAAGLPPMQVACNGDPNHRAWSYPTNLTVNGGSQYYFMNNAFSANNQWSGTLYPLQTINGHGSHTHTATNQNTGGGQPHEHPYLVVYRWKRLPNTGEVKELNLTEMSLELRKLRAIVDKLTAERS